jgi:hypothetical protein
MKIRMTITLPADSEIQFADACNGAAAKLTELARRAIHDGDHEQFRGTSHTVVSDNDEAEDVGTIAVSI